MVGFHDHFSRVWGRTEVLNNPLVIRFHDNSNQNRTDTRHHARVTPGQLGGEDFDNLLKIVLNSDLINLS